MSLPGGCKFHGEEAELDVEGGGLTFGFGRLVEVEGFLGIPAFYVGALCLTCRKVAVDFDVAFVELSTFHVEVCDFDFHFSYFRVEVVCDEEAFEVAAYSLVEAVETDGRKDLFCE